MKNSFSPFLLKKGVYRDEAKCVKNKNDRVRTLSFRSYLLFLFVVFVVSFGLVREYLD